VGYTSLFAPGNRSCDLSPWGAGVAGLANRGWSWHPKWGAPSAFKIGQSIQIKRGDFVVVAMRCGAVAAQTGGCAAACLLACCCCYYYSCYCCCCFCSNCRCCFCCFCIGCCPHCCWPTTRHVHSALQHSHTPDTHWVAAQASGWYHVQHQRVVRLVGRHGHAGVAVARGRLGHCPQPS
jgi:hypothetical protein